MGDEEAVLFANDRFYAAFVGKAVGDAVHTVGGAAGIEADIDDESLDAILSDDQIVEKLRQDGIKVARRTVAKYRESLKIPSSVQRRRQKANDLPMT